MEAYPRETLHVIELYLDYEIDPLTVCLLWMKLFSHHRQAKNLIPGSLSTAGVAKL